MITLNIVDDHKMVVESLCRMINDSGVAKVTNVYYTIESCSWGLEQVVPDILLLDIGLPDGDGVEFCAELKKKYPGLGIIMLTTYKELNIVRRALHNGANGYILKNAEIREVLTGIEMVSCGEQFICEEVELLLKNNPNKNEKIIWISNREKEVLSLIAEGLTTDQIAAQLSIHRDTVKTHRDNIFAKLNVKNMAEMVKKAYEMKLIW
ncbi:MAG: response regulator transcription factor [Tannerellaceae bacterium]|nr:response regulator transcription factor [Tannerellaceae bacterium]